MGILTNLVAGSYPMANVIGIEVSPEQIERAKADFSGTPNLRFLNGNALSLDFEEGTFDVVYCRYFLEHVSNATKVLSEILRVLKTGGRVFVQENNILIYSLFPDCPAYMLVLSNFAKLQSKIGGDAEIGRKLFSLLKQTGFDSINLSIAPEIHYYGLPTFDP